MAAVVPCKVRQSVGHDNERGANLGSASYFQGSDADWMIAAHQRRFPRCHIPCPADSLHSPPLTNCPFPPLPFRAAFFILLPSIPCWHHPRSITYHAVDSRQPFAVLACLHPEDGPNPA